MVESTEKQKIGRLGEDIAKKYLENKDFTIIARNYLKKCGEIDIIAQKGKILHFVEVKSVSREKSSDFGVNVSRETDKYSPEDNIHPFKLKRLSRTVQLYLLEKHPNAEPEWVFDAITVKINTKTRQAHVRILSDIVL